MKLLNTYGLAFLTGLAIFMTQCGPSSQQESGGSADTTQQSGFNIKISNQSQAGINAAEGFKVNVFADSLGQVRNMDVKKSNGDLYGLLAEPKNGHCMVAIRDENRDGNPDSLVYFGDNCGRGTVKIHDGFLYFSNDSTVLRTKFSSMDELVPSGETQVIAEGFTYKSQHGNKNFSIDNQNNLYVTVGAPSNACMEEMRTPGSKGMDPCPILEKYGGIWKFKADEQNQDQMEDGQRFATGIRNMVAQTWNEKENQLYGLQHGRDQLNSFFPEKYTKEESAKLPAEEMFMLNEGDNFGWPYCYYDPMKDKKVLAPEYGGDGDSVGRCSQFEDPIMAFPAHYAPNDIMFYTGGMFPDEYQNGAFIAFHGSWNRNEYDQWGYDVVFVPFDGKQPSGEWQTFAEKFEGQTPIESAGDAKYRPCGLAQGPEGEMYIADDTKGRIWRVTYSGNEKAI